MSARASSALRLAHDAAVAQAEMRLAAARACLEPFIHGEAMARHLAGLAEELEALRRLGTEWEAAMDGVLRLLETRGREDDRPGPPDGEVW